MPIMFKGIPEEQVTEEQFLNAYIEHAMRYIQTVPDAVFTRPDMFLQPGDLQAYANVVSNWHPKAPPNLYKPDLTLLTTMGLVREGAEQPTFRGILLEAEERHRRWCIANKHNPANANETPEERTRRQNAERQAEFRKRQRGEDGAPVDPVFLALDAERKRLTASVRAGRAWAKGEERRLRAQLQLDIKAAHDLVDAEKARLEDINLQIAAHKTQ